MQRIKGDLQKLSQRELVAIVLRLQIRAWVESYYALPRPLRILVDTGLLAVPVTYINREAVESAPRMFPLFIWAGSYCSIIMIDGAARLFQRPRRRIHWLQPIVDEEDKDLDWK